MTYTVDDTSTRQVFTVTSWTGSPGGWQDATTTSTRFARSGTSWVPQSGQSATSTTHTFDPWGRRTQQVQFTQVDGSNNNLYRLNAHVYNGEGRIVQRREFSKVGNDGTWQQAPAGQPQPNYRFVYANGESLATLSEALGTSRTTTPETELQASGIAGTGGPYAAGGGVVVAQAGETLRSLSQRVYGSSSYWYVLAEANGYSSGEEVIATGQGLKAPALSVSRNDSSTYRPFDPNTALGGTMGVPVGTPNSQGCQQVGQLLMVVVAVIVTIYTAGAASGFTGSVMGTMQAGVTALGTNMTAAAIGGAVGSIASQTVGVMTGAIQDFSWRGVATSALTAGIGAGVGGFIGNPVLRAGAAGLGSAAVSSAINDGGFSWRQVAANVVGNAIGSAAGNAVGGALSQGATTAAGQFAAGLTSKFVGGMVSMHARRALGSDEAVNYGNVAADAFANTLVDRWTGVHAAGAKVARKQAAAESSSGMTSGKSFASGSTAYTALPDGGMLLSDGQVKYGVLRPYPLGEASADVASLDMGDFRLFTTAQDGDLSSVAASSTLQGNSAASGPSHFERSQTIPRMLQQAQALYDQQPTLDTLSYVLNSNGNNPLGKPPELILAERLMRNWRQMPEQISAGRWDRLMAQREALDAGTLDLPIADAVRLRGATTIMPLVYMDVEPVMGFAYMDEVHRSQSLVANGIAASAFNPLSALTSLVARGFGASDETAAKWAIGTYAVSAPFSAAIQARAARVGPDWQSARTPPSHQSSGVPYRTEYRNGYRFEIGPDQNVQYVFGQLQLNPSQARSQLAQRMAGGPFRLVDDQGGHYVARQFNGPLDDFNHFAQNGNFNMGAYRALERQLAESVRGGNNVQVSVTPHFNIPSRRPDRIEVRYWENGVESTVYFRNRRGGK